MRIESIAVHAGRPVDPATGAVTPPIHLSTTFERAADGSYPHGHLYARNSNPTRTALEECVAELEGGAAAAAFSSGNAASAAVFQALRPGDHVVISADAYYGTRRMLCEHFGAWGLEATIVDMTEPARVREALRPTTRIVWLESPSNPLWKITDIAAVVDVAHRAGAAVVADNSVATPVLQRPFGLGVDLVHHASTKYLGGHADVIGGLIVARTSDDLFARIRNVQPTVGGVPSPFDCWLVLRGIATLPWRMRAHSDNAMRVATFLAAHPRVEAVHYPGLDADPGHAVAKRQMSAFSGMLSFRVRGDAATAMSAAAKLRLITRATSYGGTESLIEHRASIEGPGTTTPENLLRFSVGLEHPDDLVEDLAQALSA